MANDTGKVRTILKFWCMLSLYYIVQHVIELVVKGYSSPHAATWPLSSTSPLSPPSTTTTSTTPNNFTINSWPLSTATTRPSSRSTPSRSKNSSTRTRKPSSRRWPVLPAKVCVPPARNQGIYGRDYGGSAQSIAEDQGREGGEGGEGFRRGARGRRMMMYMR